MTVDCNELKICPQVTLLENKFLNVFNGINKDITYLKTDFRNQKEILKELVQETKKTSNLSTLVQNQQEFLKILDKRIANNENRVSAVKTSLNKIYLKVISIASLIAAAIGAFFKDNIFR